jgi:hypothetical protein
VKIKIIVYAEGMKRNETKPYYEVEVSMDVCTEINLYVLMHALSPEYTQKKKRPGSFRMPKFKEHMLKDCVLCVDCTFAISLSLPNSLLKGQHSTH